MSWWHSSKSTEEVYVTANKNNDIVDSNKPMPFLLADKNLSQDKVTVAQKTSLITLNLRSFIDWLI